MSTPGHTPDTSGQRPDNHGGHVRTPILVGETIDCGPLPTRPDTVRTRPDTDPPDTSGRVRVEYRARVPRHLMAAAFAEALDLIARETRTPQEDLDDA
ncbi:hypothetical protein [Streptomyces sp. 2P-4]|uniref:hypothetical protein n=1 Tax=Streptomyces sp. 2P-4 TaxID=2931974 RepID=UPI00254232CE|nr:hypothetical protein [Streptomyces sp. 2P-4]